jgi:hypothetical protein
VIEIIEGMKDGENKQARHHEGKTKREGYGIVDGGNENQRVGGQKQQAMP